MLHRPAGIRCFTGWEDGIQILLLAGDTAPEFQRDTLLFLQWMLRQLEGVWEDSRLSGAGVGCINAFLLKNGLDVFSQLGLLHEGQTLISSSG